MGTVVNQTFFFFSDVMDIKIWPAHSPLNPAMFSFNVVEGRQHFKLCLCLPFPCMPPNPFPICFLNPNPFPKCLLILLLYDS